MGRQGDWPLRENMRDRIKRKMRGLRGPMCFLGEEWIFKMFIFSMEREINIISEKRKLFETISLEKCLD